jgi:hypothetical protein
MTYRDSAAPITPSPSRFSPLRPLRLAVWWMLGEWSEKVGYSTTATDTAAVLIAWCIAASVIGLLAQIPPFLLVRVIGAAIVIAGHAPWVLRLWLRSAMRFDDAETRAWWEARFTR